MFYRLQSNLWAHFPSIQKKIGGFKRLGHSAAATTIQFPYPSNLQEIVQNTTMKFFIILASSFCCASAFGLHAATSSVKNVAFGFTKSKPMVQPIDLSGRSTTVTNARDSMVRFPY
jgi:hypothetical protein